jgi:hypothetical protein
MIKDLNLEDAIDAEEAITEVLWLDLSENCHEVSQRPRVRDSNLGIRKKILKLYLSQNKKVIQNPKLQIKRNPNLQSKFNKINLVIKTSPPHGGNYNDGQQDGQTLQERR